MHTSFGRYEQAGVTFVNAAMLTERSDLRAKPLNWRQRIDWVRRFSHFAAARGLMSYIMDKYAIK